MRRINLQCHFEKVWGLQRMIRGENKRLFKLNHKSKINQRQIKLSPVFTKRETRPRVYRFLLVPRVTGLGVGVFDTLSDSIQCLKV